MTPADAVRTLRDSGLVIEGPAREDIAGLIERLRSERDEWHARAFAMFWKLPGDLKVSDLHAHTEMAKKFIETEPT